MGITGMLLVIVAHMALLLMRAPNPNPFMLVIGYSFTALITFVGLILRINDMGKNKTNSKNKQPEQSKDN